MATQRLCFSQACLKAYHIHYPSTEGRPILEEGALPNSEAHPRDKTLARISQIGRRRWKRASDYYRQSIAENAIYRFKRIFGPALRSRKLAQQITEARIKCSALNRMAQLGMPDSYPVLAG